MSTIAERVAAGAAWLDENVPDWVERIDLARLDVSDCVDCVLGQLFGGFSGAPRELIGFDAYPERKGFDLDARLVYTEAPYRRLTAQWRRVIEERRTRPADAS